jgi:tRNA A37 methylthiotransferase MiaB
VSLPALSLSEQRLSSGDSERRVAFLPSLQQSKALKMQQDLEDKKHEVIIENLESKLKEQSDTIEKKTSSFRQVKAYWQKPKLK